MAWQDEVVQRTNILTNTRFALTGSTYAVRTNLNPNPNMATTAGYTGVNATALTVQSAGYVTPWPGASGKSLAITAAASGIGAYAHIGGDAGGMRLGMQAGKTYTVSGYTSLNRIFQGSSVVVSTRYCTATLFYKTTSSGSTYFEVSAPQRSMAVSSSFWFSLTASLPADTIEAFVRLHNGSNNTGDTIWYSNVIVEERGAAHRQEDFFTGSLWPSGAAGFGLTPGWTGTADNSTSTLTGTAPSGWFSEQCRIWKGYPNSGQDLCVLATTASGAYVYQDATYSGEFTFASNVNGNAISAGLSVEVYNSGSSRLATYGPTFDVTNRRDVVSSSTVPSDVVKTRFLFNIAANTWKIVSFSQPIAETDITNGSYFDGLTPDLTTYPYTSYRWTGAVDASTAQQYIPQQTNPTSGDSYSSSAGYRGTYYVDNIDIQSYAFGISKVAHAVPEIRGSNTIIPGRSGIVPRFNRSYDVSELALSMWIIGCNPDGSIPDAYSSRYAKFLRNFNMLQQLLSAQNGVVTVTHTPAGSTQDSTESQQSLSAACIANGMTSIDTMMNRQRAEVTVSLTLVDSFWKGTLASNSGNSVVTIDKMGTAPVEDSIVAVSGPVAIPRVTCPASGAWFQYNGNLASGDLLVVNSQDGTATINGVSVMSKITHGGHPLLMYIPPRNTGVNASSSISGFAPNLILTGSGITGATTVTVQYYPRYMVSM